MIFFRIFTPFKFPFIIFIFVILLRGKSALHLLNNKVKVVNSCVKNDMDLKKSVSKVVGSRRFTFSTSLNIYWHTIVLIETKMKPPKKQACFSLMYLIYKIIKNEKWLYFNDLYARKYLIGSRNKQRFNVEMETVCDTHINENSNDRVICSQGTFITQWMPLNFPYKQSNIHSIYYFMIQKSTCQYNLFNNC